jgi:hypothetical protein
MSKDRALKKGAAAFVASGDAVSLPPAAVPDYSGNSRMMMLPTTMLVRRRSTMGTPLQQPSIEFPCPRSKIQISGLAHQRKRKRSECVFDATNAAANLSKRP